MERTFFSSSTSSALRIWQPRLSTTASLARRSSSRSSRTLSICDDRFPSEPIDLRDSCDTRFGTGTLLGEDGPAPGDWGADGDEFFLLREAMLPEERELWKDALAASSSASGDLGVFFRNESAAVFGGEFV